MSPNSRAVRIRSAISRRRSVRSVSSSCLRVVALGGEDHVLQRRPPRVVARTRTRRDGRHADAHGSGGSDGGKPPLEAVRNRRLPSATMVDLRETWSIGPVEIPTRLVLAPMAGVSVQAFRRQGRRFGAGLVCSEMVSCAGIEHRNERTLGYLRVAADEHPLAIQLFGSEPRTMAEAARMVEAAGADLVDLNFGCPVRKVTKTGAGATLLDDPDRAARIVVRDRRGGRHPGHGEAAARAAERLTRLPRRRAAAGRGRRGVADAASPLCAADVHGQRRSRADCRARLARRRPVVASGDIVSRAKAQAVLATTGASAVMVGRAAQGNPWVLEEIVDGTGASRPAKRSSPSSCCSSARPCASSASGARAAS